MYAFITMIIPETVEANLLTSSLKTKRNKNSTLSYIEKGESLGNDYIRLFIHHIYSNTGKLKVKVLFVTPILTVGYYSL